MTYDPTQLRSSENHPDTIVCDICGETIKWEEAGSHYLLSGYYGCVNKPKSILTAGNIEELIQRVQRTWMNDDLKREIMLVLSEYNSLLESKKQATLPRAGNG